MPDELAAQLPHRQSRCSMRWASSAAKRRATRRMTCSAPSAAARTSTATTCVVVTGDRDTPSAGRRRHGRDAWSRAPHRHRPPITTYDARRNSARNTASTRSASSTSRRSWATRRTTSPACKGIGEKSAKQLLRGLRHARRYVRAYRRRAHQKGRARQITGRMSRERATATGSPPSTGMYRSSWTWRTCPHRTSTATDAVRAC